MTNKNEDLASYRERARAWLAENMAPSTGEPPSIENFDREHYRQQWGRLAEGGWSGIPVPVEYGGQGLTVEHQKVFWEEAAPYDMPVGVCASVTNGMIVPTLLEFATEEFKLEHIPKILRGEEIWVQLLSEPSGGSDMAGALTRATRDGETWVINGAKIWSTAAQHSDYGMCLTRTDWDAVKHAGLSFFALPLRAPGVTVELIRLADGSADFCQEFFDDVSVPASHLVGAVNDGWTVAQRLLAHERNATAGIDFGVGFDGAARKAESSSRGGSAVDDLADAARRRGVAKDSSIRQLVAEAYINESVQQHVDHRVMTGYRTGKMPGPWGSVVMLGESLTILRRAEIAMIISGEDGVMWPADESGGDVGRAWLIARARCMAGGTSEIQRNIIGERLLGLPREPAADRGLPFSQVKRGAKN